MRRLPIYFLIDASESMVGTPIEAVQDGMATIIQELRKDPYALETVCISIIIFAGKAKKLISMEELYKFYPPKLPIGGGTSLGSALKFLMDDIDLSVKKTTYEEKGDWKPLVFLLTDGVPTDSVDSAFDEWNRKFKRKANLVAISLGDANNTALLGRITENVLLLNQTNAESYKEFFKWVTASIKTTSVSVSERNDEELNLASLKNTTAVTKIDLEKSTKPITIDENFAVITAKCQATRKPYLIKYQKHLDSSSFRELNVKALDFKLVGAYQVDDSYFELSDSRHNNRSVNTMELVGFPSCPCCGNQYGFSYCSCGKIMCTGGEKMSTCPWCGTKAEFGFSEGHADVTRGQG